MVTGYNDEMMVILAQAETMRIMIAIVMVTIHLMFLILGKGDGEHDSGDCCTNDGSG